MHKEFKKSIGEPQNPEKETKKTVLKHMNHAASNLSRPKGLSDLNRCPETDVQSNAWR